ncbi:radical SAM protein [Seleniivibrio woodruffii]|uniref:radical SAM protein n=1 Tax=Seleniivibrio woodruffii TaxID=1078050 RepID=UPI002409F27A|nr:radical SAM protein [Seleniivibrio woodruffii]
MNRLTAVDLHDGLAVETVVYPYGTVCISSQAGCRMACPFCASGRKGLVRSLTAEEMLLQVETAPSAKRVTVSGIGEPLDNFDEVARFIALCPLPVSVTTTASSTELLKKLLLLPHNGVMISIHGGTEDAHKKLVPKAPPLIEIYSALASAWEQMSVRARKRVGLNYLPVAGINDSEEEIELFAQAALKFPESSVHLLSLNKVPNSPFQPVSHARRDEIFQLLRGQGINVRRANAFRRQEKGGCGTLWLKKYID